MSLRPTKPSTTCFSNGSANQEKKTFKEEVQVSHGQKDRDGWIVSGLAHIYASFNDTFVNITDLSGKKTDLRRHLSQGQSRRVLPYAAQDVAEKFYLLGITALRINLPKEEMALRAMACSSMKIGRIEDVTGVSNEDCVLLECSLLAKSWTTQPPSVITPKAVTEARTERADMSQEVVMEEEEGIEV
ncbi:40S ribosomal protein S14 [Culex quinquefasciatus]|uniref:40S ribosomal protein S14 n=1 Tax=Culex quinquefasciatus TaxID=7176 RepID=B0W7U4_CULQU|nr:40S ribosomal protein S14 [Culex quinquefasciatus]|eukprot:XP_001844778.1 40S ribosomal protein S14 [Culex quinquefasciatus]